MVSDEQMRHARCQETNPEAHAPRNCTGSEGSPDQRTNYGSCAIRCTHQASHDRLQAEGKRAGGDGEDSRKDSAIPSA